MTEEQWRCAIKSVVKNSVVGDESPAEVAEVGIRLGRHRATLLGRDLEWGIDIPVPLIYLCWWIWKPEASPAVRERIVATRQRVIQDCGYEGLQLSDKLLVRNPFGTVSEAALPEFMNIREHVLSMKDQPALSDQLVVSNIPFEKYVAGQHVKFFGAPFDLSTFETEND